MTRHERSTPHERLTPEEVARIWPPAATDAAWSEAEEVHVAFLRWSRSYAATDEVTELTDELAMAEDEIRRGMADGGAMGTSDQLGHLHAIRHRIAEVKHDQARGWTFANPTVLMVGFTHAVVELARWEQTIHDIAGEMDFWEGRTGARAKALVTKLDDRELEAETEVTRLEDLIERMHTVIVERMTYDPGHDPAIVSTPGPE